MSDYSDACIVAKKAIDLLTVAANEYDKTEKNVDHAFQKLIVNW